MLPKKTLLPLALFALVTAVVAGLWLGGDVSQEEPPDAGPSALETLHAGKFAASKNLDTIFTEGLWRRPSPQDKILNAERREWSEGPDLNHWQWFLHVEAGKDLIDYLRVANAFGLRPAVSAEIIHAPAWFPSDLTDYEIQRAGSLTFLFHKTSNTFYATSQGKGFTKALPIQPAAPQPTGPQPQSRIPSTPPPSPRE